MEPTGIAALGLDWKAFIFQVINFVVLFTILRIFAYPAILQTLEGRKKKIDEQLKNANELERQLARTHEETERIIDAAHERAKEVIALSRAQAQEILDEAYARTQQETERMLHEARSQLASDVAQARNSLKKEAAGLVVSATERVLGEKMTGEDDIRLINRALV